MELDPQKLREYFDFARELVAAAGRITLNYFRTALEVERKPDASPVTIADRETEIFIRSEILAKYSDHGVLGEEFGESNPGAPLRWIVDPIDGTQAFINGVPLYTVLLALEFERDAVLGIVHCPPQNETVAAAQGLGCLWNGTPCRVSDCSELGKARVQATDFASLMQWRPKLCDAVLRQAKWCRGWGDAYGYLLVATGRAEVMIDPILNLWDVAALKPVIEEAGGRFTDLEGHAGIHVASGLATNGKLHEELLKLSRS